MTRLLFAFLAIWMGFGMAAQAQPLRLQITEGVIEPMPFAVPAFVPEDNGGMEYADALSRVVASNLSGTGLFREVPRESHIARITSFDTSISYPDWRAVNAQALIVGGGFGQRRQADGQVPAV